MKQGGRLRKKGWRPLSRRLKDKAEAIFHAWIRERDRNKGCITCSGPVEQAGHWKHGVCDFEEWNLNGQCLKDNYFKSGDGSTYTLRLIDMYGLKKVREFEKIAARSQGRKYSVAELKEIIAKYQGLYKGKQYNKT